jgi:hypothetical protein
MTMPRMFPGLLLALAAGCVDASAFLLGDVQFEPRPPSHEIAVYDTFDDVPYAYVKVARVVASGSGHAAWDRVFDALKRRAREVGGDAIVLQRGGEDSSDLDGEGGVAMRRTLWALAIRRTQPKSVPLQ